MNDDQQDELVMGLVERALARPPHEREAYLRDACENNSDLFNQVWPYVEWEHRMMGFLAEPLLEFGRVDRLNPSQLLAGRFRVVREVAQGGMGIVYEALDEKLGQRIAIKCAKTGYSMRLPPEARSARAISHPNICRIFEIHTASTDDGDIDFLTMEFLDGETLAERIRRGPLPEGEMRNIARQLSNGLAEAHRNGVIHGDLKSNNIILTSGPEQGVRAVITDFGLARMTTTALRTAQSGEQGGTPDYMAPELRRGEKASPASDVYALGVIFYELASGQRPFSSTTGMTQSTSHALFEDSGHSPRPVHPQWDPILARCLDSRPEQRFQDADELRNAMTVQWRERQQNFAASIAVLPFRSLSSDSADEYFSHGLTEELTDALTRLDGLRVAPRTSVFAIKDAKGLAEIAARLGVGLVLDGAVRKRDSRLSVHVQLINAPEERVLWSERFDRDLTDVFAVQEDIAGKVANTLKIRLSDDPVSHLVKRYTTDLRAYNLYLKGRYQWNRESPEALFKAVETFRQASEADPNYVSPLCGLAECYLVIGARGLLQPGDAWSKARDASKRALALNPALADAHGCMGAVLAISDFNWAAAEREFRYGLELDAESASTRHWYAIALLAPQARFDEAVAETTRAIEREPLSLIYNSTLAWIYYLAGRWEEAVEQCAKTLEIDPHHPDSLWCMGSAYRELGRPQEALAALRKLEQVAPGIPLVYASLGHGYAMAGNTAEAEKMLRAVQEAGRRIYSSPICESWIYANLPGQQDAALASLERAYADRDFLIRYIHMSRALSSLWNHPGFRALVHRMGLGEPATDSVETGSSDNPSEWRLRKRRNLGKIS